jgi:uncharacterized protein (DUF433 family)
MLSGDIKMLRGSYERSYRRRVGNWRLIFTLRPNQELSVFFRKRGIISTPKRKRPDAGGIGDMMRLQQVAHRDPDILGGTPVFLGTRVPIRSLFDYLEGGDTLEEFLRQFPSVRREQAMALLELAREAILADARAA